MERIEGGTADENFPDGPYNLQEGREPVVWCNCDQPIRRYWNGMLVCGRCRFAIDDVYGRQVASTSATDSRGTRSYRTKRKPLGSRAVMPSGNVKRSRGATVSGSGGYLFKDAPSDGYFPGAGRAAGEAAGMAASEFLHGFTGGASAVAAPYITEKFANLGDRIGKWSGLGPYRLSSRKRVAYRKRRATYRPRARTYRLSPSTASFAKSGDGIRIKHREYIGDVLANGLIANGSTQFGTAYTIPLNPGLSSSFPWLSNLANSFEEYQWKSLIFQFRSTSANAITGTNPNIGEVIMATCYNAAASLPPYSNKTGMLNQEFATAARVTQNAVSAVECDPRKTNGRGRLYVRDAPVPTGQDPKTYDVGVFQIATNGLPSNCTVGELWVTYDIMLSKPTEVDNQGSAIVPVRTSHFILNAPTNIYPLGPSPPSASQTHLNQWGASISNPNGQNVLTFPPGSVGAVQITLYYVGASTASVGLPAPVFTNCSTATLFNNLSNIAEDSGVTGSMLLVTFFVQLGTGASNLPSTLTFANGTTGGTNTLPTGLTGAELFITSVAQVVS